MKFSIRPASIDDADSISSLILGLKDLILADPGAPEVKPFLETLSPESTAERIKSDEFEYFVAEVDGAIRGVIGMRDKSHLYHLFVHPTAHRKGVARTLWTHVLSRSNDTAFTVNSTPYAIGVYERMGFEATDSLQRVDGLEFLPMKYSHVG